MPLACFNFPTAHYFGMKNMIRVGYFTLVAVVVSVVILAVNLRADGHDWLVNDALPDWQTIGLFPLLALAWCGIVTFELMRRRSKRPFAVLKAMFKRSHMRLLSFAPLYFLIAINTKAFSALKPLIPSIRPFYLDPLLIEIDRAIFGTDPWRITHSLVGAFGTLLIDRLYIAFFPITAAMIYWIILNHDHRFRLRALLTSILISF